MPRWVVYRNADGLVLRSGRVANAADLGALDTETEEAVEDSTPFDPSRIYAWTGEVFADVGPRMGVSFYASSTRADTASAPIGADWTIVERTFTKAAFFSRNDQGLFANAIGMVEATGGSVLVRMMEDPGHENGGARHYDGTDDRNLTASAGEGAGHYTIEDTGGEWVALDIHSDQPLTLADHHSEFRLEMKLGTASAGTVRAPSFGLMEAHGKPA